MLCDPKIVEFKKMATEFPMPQITAIAATSDIDYVISVLDEQKEIMMKRNHLFIELTKSGTSSFWDTEVAERQVLPKLWLMYQEQLIVWERYLTKIQLVILIKRSRSVDFQSVQL